MTQQLQQETNLNLSYFGWWIATDIHEGNVLSYPELQKAARERRQIDFIAKIAANNEIIRKTSCCEFAPNGTVHIVLGDEDFPLHPHKQLYRGLPYVSRYWFLDSKTQEILGPRDLKFDQKGISNQESRTLDLFGEMDDHRLVNCDENNNIEKVIRICSDDGEGTYLAIGRWKGLEEFFLLKGMATKSVINAFVARAYA